MHSRRKVKLISLTMAIVGGSMVKRLSRTTSSLGATTGAHMKGAM
ncbi:hypothetical protein LINGRAHAP2_LOCUS34549 [Linum grandiflorum]